jgi:putative ABC transport system permease protein
MIRNYITIALRIMKRHLTYSFINVFGVALGLAVGAFALMYIIEETSFDKFHSKRDRVYRVITKLKSPDNRDFSFSDANGWPVGYALAESFPEVETSLYMRASTGFSLNHGGGYVEEQTRMAGPEFFDIFDFELLEGDKNSALRRPFSMVISERMAAKYFPNEKALGKTLTANDSIPFAITGVAKNPPRTSHIQFDILISFSTWESGRGDGIKNEGWFNINMLNYVMLKEGTNFQEFQAKAKSLYMDKAEATFKEFGYEAEVAFEPLNGVYLHSAVNNSLGPKGRLTDVFILSAVALLVIVLASINFINLATARSVDRAREVGLRKVSGSTRGKLIGQFLSESVITSLFSLMFAFGLLGLALPLLNLYTGKHFTLADWSDWRVAAASVSLCFTIGVLSGFYPALVLSKFAPMQVLRGAFKTTARGVALRRSLVVVQFFISVILIASVLIIGRQLNYMNEQSLGFNKEEVLVVETGKLAYSVGTEKYPLFKSIMSSHSFVKSISASNGIPGTNGWRGQVAYPEGKSPEESVDTEYLAVDPDYVSMLGLEIIAGRDFRNDEADKKDGLLINEETARVMGWGTAENAVGRRILSPSSRPAGVVVGVFKDYHQHGLQEKIQPVVMDQESHYLMYYLVRFQPNATRKVIEKAEATWKQLYSGYDFKYTFLDEAFAQQYQSEEKLSKLFLGFAVLAVVIAAIGLFGLSAFMIVNRTKEIGVRKVLGAPGYSIVALLSKDFLVWVAIANVMAWPALYWIGKNWLERFAYRTEIGMDLFLSTLLVSVVITILAISYQAIQAIRMNPVESLRSE